MSKTPIIIKYGNIVTKGLVDNAYIRHDFPGFHEDYLTIHCLLRRHKPKRFMEIGTSTGLGTKVIARALGIKKRSLIGRLLGKTPTNDAALYSLDVVPGTDPKIIYPAKEDGHPDKAGKYCDLPYTQLFGDSQRYDYSSLYPIDGWFIDGKHNYDFVKVDTKQALKSNPKIIIWHDFQIPEVKKAVEDILKFRRGYKLYCVEGTRIAFATKS